MINDAATKHSMTDFDNLCSVMSDNITTIPGGEDAMQLDLLSERLNLPVTYKDKSTVRCIARAEERRVADMGRILLRMGIAAFNRGER